MLFRSCYSHPDPDVRQQRFVAHAEAAARLADLDQHPVFAPVVHGHTLVEIGGLGLRDHAFWMRQCLPILKLADVLVVLQLDGLEESEGTLAEIHVAHNLGIPVLQWDGVSPHILEEAAWTL